MNLQTARAWFAEDLRYTIPLHCENVVAAFANVEREKFLGPPPWLLVYVEGSGPDLETDDAGHLYHNVLVAIDRKRRINNGEPKLWAGLYDKLAIKTGERVLHVGAGTGYYTAILAEITGASGRVTGVEFDATLAARAGANLADRPNVSLVQADGCVHDPGEVDVIVVNAGVTQPQALWLDRLDMGGRLLVPLTADDNWGHFLMVTKTDKGYGAQFVSRVGIIHCVSHRQQDVAQDLERSFRGGSRQPLSAVQSLHRGDQPDDSCVVAGPGYWLSTCQPG